MFQAVSMVVATVFWLALSVAGLVTDNDPVFIVGILASVVNSVGFGVLVEIKKIQNT